MIETARKGVVFDVDGTLIDSEGNLLPGSEELIRMLRQAGIELALWTGSEEDHLMGVVRRHKDLLGGIGRLISGGIMELISRQKWNPNTPEQAMIIEWMERKGMKHPGFLTDREVRFETLVDDDYNYEGRSLPPGYLWIDPNAADLPNRREEGRGAEWADEIFRRIRQK